MFGLFKKQSQEEVLRKKYEKLSKQAFELSKVNRAEGDRKFAEAEEVMKELEALRK